MKFGWANTAKIVSEKTFVMTLFYNYTFKKNPLTQSKAQPANMPPGKDYDQLDHGLMNNFKIIEANKTY